MIRFLLFLLLPGILVAQAPSPVFVPAGGNAWLSAGADKLTDEGVVNWSDPASKLVMYVRVSAGDLQLALNLSAPTLAEFSVTIAGVKKMVNVDPAKQVHEGGTWKIPSAGYVSVEVQGLTKSGSYFGSLAGLTLKGSAVTDDLAFVKDNEGSFFYWGRRGPSVHLRYDLAGKTEVEYFYSEITVPAGNDVIGSYYMANGFADGYFGFQVNSETERRILFSVWSPFKTDDPKSIPESDRILLKKKGEGVYTGEFGNEGSGGQSYWQYPWKAGTTYGFLLRAQPQTNSTTIYTAWFFAPELKAWKLIASWQRPKKAAYLTGLYSFLENFVPETGNITRMAHYGNQWIRTTSGEWVELAQAKFTGDNTARKSFRKDYGGGVSDNAFFLRNCGFFSDFTVLDQTFTRPARTIPPNIDFSRVP